MSMRVTIDNFRRAETDHYFTKFANDGGFAKFQHARGLTPIEHQTVIRLNRDTLYSYGVFDLEAAPVTVTLPDAGARYMAVQVVNQDHYVTEVFHAPVKRTLTREAVGTRYLGLLGRTFVDPNQAADITAVHALQDAIRIAQTSSGKFEPAPWDQASLQKVREAILSLVRASGSFDSSLMFGRKDEVDPVHHLLGTASAWGGNPRAEAMYIGKGPEVNDGAQTYVLTVRDVPVNGFWSISVYNRDGFFEKNEANAYTVNNITAKPDPDGSVTIRFGGDNRAPNYLYIMPGWNYVFRMYRPRPELLDGAWKLPELENAVTPARRELTE